jgi:long-chain acyl-CoA synthetase
MLYELWRQIVDREGDRWALRDLSSRRSWTFRELDAAARRQDKVCGRLRYPQGVSEEFLLATIGGWRQGQVICPLEPGQARPILEGLPAGWVHLKTTSASTGKPRVIGFTASQLVADVDSIVTTMGLRREWPNLGVISMAHSYGFSSLVLPLLLRGIPLILGSSALPEAVGQVTAKFGPLTLPAVPALWRTWHQAGSISRHIRLAISAGAPLPIVLEAEVFRLAGVKIHNFYGASECGGIAYDTADQPRTAETCAGRPMRNVGVSIDPSGCLCVNGAAVGESYWPEPTPSLRDSRFLTSDLAELRDGEIHLFGRATDVINVAGRKVLPETIEQALCGCPGLESSLVFGAPSAASSHGEIIVALLVVRGRFELATLRRFLGDRLPTWQIPRVWSVVDKLGVNARGKISRADWRRRYLAGDPSIRLLGWSEVFCEKAP